MENILQSDPDIDGMFCINDPTAAGAISAIEGARKKVLVSSVDGSQDAMRLIKSGKQLSTSSQNPKIMGSTAVVQMYKVLAGQKIEHYVEVAITLIDAKNVDKYFGK
jgi:ribose transport system substrate-binding protein